MSSISSTPTIDAVKANPPLARSSLTPDRQILIVHTAVFATLPANVQFMEKPAITVGATTTLLWSAS